MQWGAFDYSQQEPRLVVHLASLTNGGLKGADEFVNAYHEDPNTDFHTMVSEMAKIDRKKAKTINLGLFYGMGKGKLSSELGLTPGEAEDLFEKYHSRVPFVKEMIELTMKKAADVGHVEPCSVVSVVLMNGSLYDMGFTDHCPGPKRKESMVNKLNELIHTKL
jgi:DNA polymerase I